MRGVAFLDHTADVGLEVEAPSLEELFHRAAVGMLMLLRGHDDEAATRGPAGDDAAGDDAATRRSAGDAAAAAEHLTVEAEAEGLERVLADWLRELLFLHETRHRDYVAAAFERLDADGVSARVELEPSGGAAREIKGVTYHGLEVVEERGGWRARVIFDV